MDSAADGVKHPDVPCYYCKMPEILGIRWQCAECQASFCSACFFLIEKRHEHFQAFKRYDTHRSDP